MGAVHLRVPAELDEASCRRLADDVDAAADGAPGVIVLEGADGVFCRGLRFASVVKDPGSDELASAMGEFRRCLAAIRFARKPVVAVVDGAVNAGGLGIAAACDVVVATPRSTFALSEVLFGLAPATIFPLLLERMTAQQARLMALCGRAYDVDEALAVGLVDLEATSDALATVVKAQVRLLSRGEPGAVASLKGLSSSPSGLGLQDAIARGAALTLDAVRSPVVRARIAAFEAGEPAWTTE